MKEPPLQRIAENSGDCMNLTESPKGSLWGATLGTAVAIVGLLPEVGVLDGKIVLRNLEASKKASIGVQ